MNELDSKKLILRFVIIVVGTLSCTFNVLFYHLYVLKCDNLSNVNTIITLCKICYSLNLITETEN